MARPLVQQLSLIHISFILYYTAIFLFLLIQRLKAGILAHEFRNNILHGSNNFHMVIGVTYINHLLDTLLHQMCIRDRSLQTFLMDIQLVKHQSWLVIHPSYV